MKISQDSESLRDDAVEISNLVRLPMFHHHHILRHHLGVMDMEGTFPTHRHEADRKPNGSRPRVMGSGRWFVRKGTR